MNRRKTGSIYEEKAAEYLAEQGYVILAKNYHNRFGELDLLAIGHPEPERIQDKSPEEVLFEPGARLVVVEVKYRRTGISGEPEEAITRGKIRHICRTVLGFYIEHGLSEDYPCRFDVIAFGGNDDLHHIQDAFSFVF
ncbi:MAG: YraN family protein [Lachnospiraceae bacterium]|nr:YraN family protein [Lachnospiraceae bacterium]